jgi:hypothetical protein
LTLADILSNFRGDRKPDKWTGKIPPIGSTVDIETATSQNTIGAVELT